MYCTVPEKFLTRFSVLPPITVELAQQRRRGLDHPGELARVNLPVKIDVSSDKGAEEEVVSSQLHVSSDVIVEEVSTT